MRNLTLTITGAFLLSLLFVATSFSSEAVIPNPTQGLQPYWTPDSTESDMAQTLKQEEMCCREYGLQPYWGSDIDQTVKPEGMYRPDYGLQPGWGTGSGSAESDMKHGDMYRPDYRLEDYSGTR